MLVTYITTIEQRLQNNEVSMKILEIQIGQLAQIVSNRLQCSLLSYTNKNLVEHVKAITVRSDEHFEATQDKVYELVSQVID